MTYYQIDDVTFSGESSPIDHHISQVCCCASCEQSDQTPNFFAELDLYFDAGAVSPSTYQNLNLPSFSWEEAAEQISRWNVKWDDEDDTGGVAGNELGTPGTVTFGFVLNPDDSTARAMTAEEISRTLQAIAEFEEVTNITFERIQDEGSEYICLLYTSPSPRDA